MTFTALARAIAVVSAFALSGMSGGAGAQMTNTPLVTLPHSPVPGHVRPAGLWDKPNEYCLTHCRGLVQKGCFTRSLKEDPTAEAADIQEQCDKKYSICLYDCMCENCKENRNIIWR